MTFGGGEGGGFWKLGNPPKSAPAEIPEMETDLKTSICNLLHKHYFV